MMEVIKYSIEKIDNGYLLHFDAYNKRHDLSKRPPKYFDDHSRALEAIVGELETQIKDEIAEG